MRIRPRSPDEPRIYSFQAVFSSLHLSPASSDTPQVTHLGWFGVENQVQQVDDFIIEHIEKQETHINYKPITIFAGIHHDSSWFIQQKLMAFQKDSSEVDQKMSTQSMAPGLPKLSIQKWHVFSHVNKKSMRHMASGSLFCLF